MPVMMWNGFIQHTGQRGSLPYNKEKKKNSYFNEEVIIQNLLITSFEKNVR